MSDAIQRILDDSFNVDDFGETLVNIDMDSIGEDALSDARSMVDNLSKFYYDEGFMKAHPNFKKRVDTELESLRILIKMRRADEAAHDVLISTITRDTGNASLYRSLSDIQKTILSITSKMNEIITSLNNMMKGYQLDLNFAEDANEGDEESSSVTTTSTHTRGTKDFIKKMNEEDEENNDEEESEEDE